MNKRNVISPRSKIYNLINNQQVSQIPKGELCIDDKAISSYGSSLSPFELKYHFIKMMNYDLVTLSPCYSFKSGELPPHKEYTWPYLKEWTAETDLFTFAVIDGAFEWGLRIFGFNDFFNIISNSHDSLMNFIQDVERFNLSIVNMLAEAGINGIILADDIAYQDGLFISPKTLRDFFIPSLARQTEAISRYKLPCFYHSDGNYLPVIRDIVEAGFTGLQCIEKRAGMDIQEIRKMFGSKLCLWGHLDTYDLADSQDKDLHSELVNSAFEYAKSGRFILGTSCGIFPGMNITSLYSLYNEICSEHFFADHLCHSESNTI